MHKIKRANCYSTKNIIDMLRQKKSFTFCHLPHHRFRYTSFNALLLVERGFAKISGKTTTGTSITPTNKFFEKYSQPIEESK